jgi:hypothetical protein
LPSNEIFQDSSAEYNDTGPEIESVEPGEPNLPELRKTLSQHFLMVHLNINSLQNKFDELKLLNKELRSQVIILSETKIDSTYKNEQFSLHGYRDKKKGGGGVMAFISSAIASKKKSTTFI